MYKINQFLFDNYNIVSIIGCILLKSHNLVIVQF